MPPCPCCGTSKPAPERIQPQGIHRVGEGHWPVLVTWLCPGAREIDRDLLRFGVIEHRPWSCGAPRSSWWKDLPAPVRSAAIQADVSWLSINGMIG